MSTPPHDPSSLDTNPSSSTDTASTARRRTRPQPNSAKGAENRVAYTLTACCRCRARKTKCDPGLPRCGPCERTNAHCEYYDPARSIKIPRNYVVYLQRKALLLERSLDKLITREPSSTAAEESHPDPEEALRVPAIVQIEETNESKYLGPSSGIAITRLVIQLAKEFADVKHVSDIVNEDLQTSMKTAFEAERAKPTSKTYPIVNNVPATDLPTRDLVMQLKKIFYLRVHPMYPIFHEPTFDRQVEEVFEKEDDPFSSFFVRMVIAISLQKMDQQYAGLADSYYLSALRHLTDCIRPMDLRTLQCCALIAGYSLLTPTRTGVYFVIGLAIRAIQALGLHDEKTLSVTPAGKPKTALEIDMSRRLFWIIVTMEFGLAHSLGRPSSFPVNHKYINVAFPEQVGDEYITDDGIVPGSPKSPTKWIAVHFFRMRLLQLEIRRKLYLVKRPEPRDDCHPWFREMEAKLYEWREASPDDNIPSGLGRTWFVGRCNTMLVFLFRPSPQVPRPSVQAAHKCFEACRYNVYLQHNQIETKSVDLTWIFTQSLFMAVNTMLWSISYAQVRIAHPRNEVTRHLEVALEAIRLASERWPGVSSALELYTSLATACLKIYDNDLGDVTLTVYPSDTSVASAGGGGGGGGDQEGDQRMSGGQDSGSSPSSPPQHIPLPPPAPPPADDYGQSLAMLQNSTRAIFRAKKDRMPNGQMGFDSHVPGRQQDLQELHELQAASASALARQFSTMVPMPAGQGPTHLQHAAT